MCHATKWANYRIFIRFSIFWVWHKFCLSCKFDFIFWLRHNQINLNLVWLSQLATRNHSTDKTNEENENCYYQPTTAFHRTIIQALFPRPDMGNLSIFLLSLLTFCSVYLLSFIVMAVCQFFHCLAKAQSTHNNKIHPHEKLLFNFFFSISIHA